MILSIINFFGGPLGKLAMYAIGALAAMGVLTGVYLNWKHGIEERQLLKFNNAQLEQSIKDKDVFIKKLEVVAQIEKQSRLQLEHDLRILGDVADTADVFLDTAKEQDRPTSEIIKETLRILNNAKGK